MSTLYLVSTPIGNKLDISLRAQNVLSSVDIILCEDTKKSGIFLKDLGININTIPVLDVIRKNTNKVIGNRSFSNDRKIVQQLGKLTLKYLHIKKIGFKGILISDDISMKALKYDLITNATKSIEAGCNLVLYCAGKTSDNFKLIKSLPYIDKFTSKKTSEFYKFLM